MLASEQPSTQRASNAARAPASSRDIAGLILGIVALCLVLGFLPLAYFTYPVFGRLAFQIGYFGLLLALGIAAFILGRKPKLATNSALRERGLGIAARVCGLVSIALTIASAVYIYAFN